MGAALISGLLAFAFYCWAKFRDPLLFLHARTAWSGEGGSPIEAAWKQLTGAYGPHYLPNQSDALVFLLFLVITIAMWKRLPMEMNLYNSATYRGPRCNTSVWGCRFLSMSRYLLLLFPCMIGMALATARRAWFAGDGGGRFRRHAVYACGHVRAMVLGGMIDRDDPTPSL